MASRPGYFKEYYKKNKDKEKNRVLSFKKQNVAKINEEIEKLKSVPCKDCGKTLNPWQMDFDHLPEFNKKYTVSRMVSCGTMALGTVLDEIKKCDVVCANCHRDRTYRRRIAA